MQSSLDREVLNDIFKDAKLTAKAALPPQRHTLATHHWENPEDYFRSQFFEVVDLLTSELTYRFNQPTLRVMIGDTPYCDLWRIWSHQHQHSKKCARHVRGLCEHGAVVHSAVNAPNSSKNI